MSFKINYKGTNCRGTTFKYVCNFCVWEQEEMHAASEEPAIECKCCGRSMSKKITSPAFDADHHESMKSHNLGGNGDA